MKFSVYSEDTEVGKRTPSFNTEDTEDAQRYY